MMYLLTAAPPVNRRPFADPRNPWTLERLDDMVKQVALRLGGSKSGSKRSIGDGADILESHVGNKQNLNCCRVNNVMKTKAAGCQVRVRRSM